MSSNDANSTIVDILWVLCMEEWRLQNPSWEHNLILRRRVVRIHRLRDHVHLEHVDRLVEFSECLVRTPLTHTQLVSKVVLGVDCVSIEILVQRIR
jgi:hypothetical protein